MSVVVNLIFEGSVFSHVEDAKSGEILEHIGHWIDVEDGLRGLQLRVMDLRNRTTDGEDVCPCCLREIPPPPPDLTWKRSVP